jgi:hypothetical protein
VGKKEEIPINEKGGRNERKDEKEKEKEPLFQCFKVMHAWLHSAGFPFLLNQKRATLGILLSQK